MPCWEPPLLSFTFKDLRDSGATLQVSHYHSFFAHAPLLTPHIHYLETAPRGHEEEATCSGVIRGLLETPSPKSLPRLESAVDS